MLPNNHPDEAMRLEQLVSARQARLRLHLPHLRQELLQSDPVPPGRREDGGDHPEDWWDRAHGTRFYPDFAGVARSHNFYPAPPLTAEDGIVAVALGLGRTVVDGEQRPVLLPQVSRSICMHFSTVDGHAGQLAARVRGPGYGRSTGESDPETRITLWRRPKPTAPWRRWPPPIRRRTTQYTTASRRPGVRLVSFAPVLKQRSASASRPLSSA